MLKNFSKLILARKSKILLIIFLVFGFALMVDEGAEATEFKPMECCRVNKEYTDVDCIGGGHPGDPGHEIVGPASKVGDTCKIKGESVIINCGTKDWGTLCTLKSIYRAGDWLFYFFLAGAVLMVVISSYLFLASGGEPAKVATSKNMLWWIAGALLLASLAKTIPIMIRAVIV